MKKNTYSEKLRDPRWQKKRLQVLERDNFTCTCCQDTSTELQVHHKAYKNEPWQAKLSGLTTLCKHCHLIVSKLHIYYDIYKANVKKWVFDEGASVRYHISYKFNGENAQDVIDISDYVFINRKEFQPRELNSIYSYFKSQDLL